MFVVAFGFLAIRCARHTVSNAPWWLVGVQALDGIGAGIVGALFPVVAADLTNGSGRVNMPVSAALRAVAKGSDVYLFLIGMLLLSEVARAARLFACAMIANAASFVLPISNAANLVLRWLERNRLAGTCISTVDRAPLTLDGKAAFVGIVATAMVLPVVSALDIELGVPTVIAGIATTLRACAIACPSPTNAVAFSVRYTCDTIRRIAAPRR